MPFSHQTLVLEGVSVTFAVVREDHTFRGLRFLASGHRTRPHLGDRCVLAAHFAVHISLVLSSSLRGNSTAFFGISFDL